MIDRIEDLLALLKTARGLVSYSQDVEVIHAIYRTPANALRHQADAIEQRDAMIAEIDAAIADNEAWLRQMEGIQN